MRRQIRRKRKIQNLKNIAMVAFVALAMFGMFKWVTIGADAPKLPELSAEFTQLKETTRGVNKDRALVVKSVEDKIYVFNTKTGIVEPVLHDNKIMNYEEYKFFGVQ